jgi:hypothetical protein
MIGVRRAVASRGLIHQRIKMIGQITRLGDHERRWPRSLETEKPRCEPGPGRGVEFFVSTISTTIWPFAWTCNDVEARQFVNRARSVAVGISTSAGG